MSNLALRDNAGPMTILGNSPSTVLTGGKIRPGIMVLTKAAQENARAKAIYGRGVEAGRSFEQIENEIKTTIPDLARPLTPRNVPYFTVRGEDFPNPSVAKQLIDKHGEDRGEGRRLYRFPVVFHSDFWQAVMPHTLRAWGASGLKFWAEYGEDGETRYCKQYAAPRRGPNGKVVRIFGGRKPAIRADNAGLCDPENCPQYQNRECNLQGRFIFFVPGVESLLPLEVPHQSWYSLKSVREALQAVAFMRKGRISGLLDERGTTFFMTKVLKEVSHIDDEGKPRRVEQWIVTIEAPIDVAAILKAQQDGTLRLAHADAAVRVYNAEALPQGGAPANEVVVDPAAKARDSAARTAAQTAETPQPEQGRPAEKGASAACSTTAARPSS